MDEYNTKLVHWAHKREIKVYKHLVHSPQNSNTSKPRTKYSDMDSEHKQASDNRRKKYYLQKEKYLIDLAIQNDLDVFITFTFAEDVTDYAKAQHEWDLFLKRMKYALKTDLKYIATYELQKKRRVYHFHALFNLGFLPKQELDALWRNGYTCIRKIPSQDRENATRYLLKYIMKDIEVECTEGIRTSKRKIYISRTLSKPTVQKILSSKTADDYIFENMEDVSETASYPIHNHLGAKINEVDSITIKKRKEN